jgi:hypothetical protein
LAPAAAAQKLYFEKEGGTNCTGSENKPTTLVTAGNDIYTSSRHAPSSHPPSVPRCYNKHSLVSLSPGAIFRWRSTRSRELPITCRCSSCTYGVRRSHVRCAQASSASRRSTAMSESNRDDLQTSARLGEDVHP